MTLVFIYQFSSHRYAYTNIIKGNTDQFGLAVIADEAKGVVERSSRNGPTTMQRQIGFAEAESAGKKRVTKR
ncbi:hypothetical protein, partial [Burkholderia cenocepacia]|uniref:hypothetical protein n=1 Tax=Burkholderia cenocepacia TaxID=95486 RepID=UPI00117F8705